MVGRRCGSLASTSLPYLSDTRLACHARCVNGDALPDESIVNIELVVATAQLLEAAAIAIVLVVAVLATAVIGLLVVARVTRPLAALAGAARAAQERTAASQREMAQAGHDQPAPEQEAASSAEIGAGQGAGAPSDLSQPPPGAIHPPISNPLPAP